MKRFTPFYVNLKPIMGMEVKWIDVFWLVPIMDPLILIYQWKGSYKALSFHKVGRKASKAKFPKGILPVGI